MTGRGGVRRRGPHWDSDAPDRRTDVDPTTPPTDEPDRSGSREAGPLRWPVTGTASHEDPARRTEPVRVRLDVEAIFDDLGLTALFDEAANVLGGRYSDASEAVFRAVATAGERARRDALVEEATHLDLRAHRRRYGDLHDELDALAAATRERATRVDPPLVDAVEAAKRDLVALHRLYGADRAAYAAAYLGALNAALRSSGATVGIELVDGLHSPAAGHDPLAARLHAHARAVTPLPMTGQPPAPGVPPAQTLRAARCTYLDRVESAHRP